MIRWVAIWWIALAFLGCSRADSEGNVVLLWHAYSGAERVALEEVTKSFNDEHQDVHLQVVPVPYDAFADKVTNAIPNGNGPDLFVYAHDRIGDWVAAGLLEPIDYFVDETVADQLAYEALAAMAYHGSLYGLPLAVKSVALFYRTDLCPQPPQTTDALLEWGRNFAEQHRGSHALVYENTDLYGHAAWLHGFGGRLFDDRERLTIATPQGRAALELAREIGGPGGIVPPELTATMVATLFNEGRAAMAISGPWFMADIAADVPWSVTALPVVSATGKRARPFLGAEGVLMSARARDKSAAFTAMAYLADNRSARQRLARAHQLVANPAAYDDEALATTAPAQRLALRAFRQQTAQAVPMPATPAMRLVWTPYKSALEGVIARGLDPDAALAIAQREIQGYLDHADSP